jgi:hypothetical protein
MRKTGMKYRPHLCKMVKSEHQAFGARGWLCLAQEGTESLGKPLQIWYTATTTLSKKSVCLQLTARM